jgi:hypothetical protein
MLLPYLHRVPLSLLPYPCCTGFFLFPCLSFLLLYTLLSLYIILFSFFSYLQCLLLGFSMVSGSSNILQSYSLDLAFSLTDLYSDSLPTLPTTYVTKLLAYAATRLYTVAVYVGVQHYPSATCAIQILDHLGFLSSCSNYVRLPLLVYSRLS